MDINTPAGRKQRTIDFYDRNAVEYAGYVDDFYSTEQVSAFLGMLPENPKVIDLGSGSGRDAYIMSQAGAEVIGLDLSAEMVRLAQQKYPDLEFVHADMLDIPYPDESFDGAWCHGVLFHLESDQDVIRTLAEANRVVKAGGVIHITVKELIEGDSVRVFVDEKSGAARVYRFFTIPELKQALKQTGWQVVIADSYQENERNPQGRHHVNWIHILAKKLS